MPSARPQHRRTSTTALRGGAGLRVSSVDNSPVDALAMAKLLAAIATERQAELDGRPMPHLAGRDKLAELRSDAGPAPDDPTNASPEVRDA